MKNFNSYIFALVIIFSNNFIFAMEDMSNNNNNNGDDYSISKVNLKKMQNMSPKDRLVSKLRTILSSLQNLAFVNRVNSFTSTGTNTLYSNFTQLLNNSSSSNYTAQLESAQSIINLLTRHALMSRTEYDSVIQQLRDYINALTIAQQASRNVLRLGRIVNVYEPKTEDKTEDEKKD